MNMKPTLKRGWCPSLFKPMETGDGFLVRIKPFLSRITSEQAHFIADTANRLGNGLINLSQKANLQLRGFSRQNTLRIIPEVIYNHLSAPTSYQEKKRNLLVSPLAALDPLCDPATEWIVQHLQTMLLRTNGLSRLSGKFSFIVDGGGQYPLTDCFSDINLRAYQGQWVIQLGHTQKVMVCSAEKAPLFVMKLAKYLAQHDPRRLIHDPEADKLFEIFETQLINYNPPPLKRSSSVGVIGENLGIGVGIPYGLMHADDLHQLAEVAQHHGDGMLHLTPWRSIILSHCSEELLSFFPRLITDEQDFRSHIIACPGEPYCPRSAINILQDAPILAQTWGNNRGYLHISGCPKGCALPDVNSITLCATDNGYNIIINGKADTDTVYMHLSLPETVAFLKHHPAPSSIKNSSENSLQ